MENFDTIDALGDKCKEYENTTSQLTLDFDKPMLVRLDGHSFHNFTKGLKRPYDDRLSNAMVETMKYLVEKTHANLGYTQSDEISLLYYKRSSQQQPYFGGRMQKLTSILASAATGKFNQIVQANIPEKKDVIAEIDCRVWNVPTLEFALMNFVWRQEDAIKNAVSMAASHYYSHKQLHQKKSREKVQMLLDKGVNFLEYPEFFKSGTFARRESFEHVLELNDDLAQYANNKGKDMVVRNKTVTFHTDRMFKKKSIEEIAQILLDKNANDLIELPIKAEKIKQRSS